MNTHWVVFPSLASCFLPTLLFYILFTIEHCRSCLQRFWFAQGYSSGFLSVEKPLSVQEALPACVALGWSLGSFLLPLQICNWSVLGACLTGVLWFAFCDQTLGVQDVW